MAPNRVSKPLPGGLHFAYSNDVPCLEGHFEDRVQNPAPVLNEIFQFVKEAPFEEEVAQRHAMGRISFDTSRVGRWERDFPNSERWAFLHHCGKLMDKVGYEWPLTSTSG